MTTAPRLNRITGHAEVPRADLTPTRRNWRSHPVSHPRIRPKQCSRELIDRLGRDNSHRQRAGLLNQAMPSADFAAFLGSFATDLWQAFSSRTAEKVDG
jgi:hypothetical protein